MPSLGIVFSSILWGLFWIPVRAIEQVGVSALWTGPVLFACVALIFLHVALIRWRALYRAGPGLILTGLLPGTAFALYTVSFNLTDVVHALLMLPATWLTIWPTTILSPARIGILFMTEAIVGIGSAARLTNEPFGLREIIGTVLIMGAGLVEVIYTPQVLKKITGI